MKFITVTNQKGGVGKTAMSLHIAEYAARARGIRTLLVDLDGQRNATFLATGRMRYEEGTVLDLWDDESPVPKPIASRMSFDVLPGNEFAAEVEKQSEEEAQKALHRLHSLDYDLVVFDTPPAVGVRQVVPMQQGGLLVVPLEPEIQAIQGLAGLLKIWKDIAEATPLSLRLVVNKRIKNSTYQEAILDTLRRTPAAGPHMLPEELTERTLVPKALKDGKPVWDYDRSDPAAAMWAVVCKKLTEQVLAVDDTETEETAHG